MASKTLYPPVVDSYMPAFQVNDETGGSCNVYFRLSKYNSSIDFRTVHATVYKQKTGTNVVRRVNDPMPPNDEDKPYRRFRENGIIINMRPIKVEDEDDLYYVVINSNDLSPGWEKGWIYKVQLRLCQQKSYEGNSQVSAWLSSNASYFSEWSIVSTVKATGQIDYTIPFLDIDSASEKKNDASEANKKEETKDIESTILDLSGNFTRYDSSEYIHSYRFILYDPTLIDPNTGDNVILEDSDDIYCDKYQDVDTIKYLFKLELEDKKVYDLAFKYETINKFVGGRYEPGDRYRFTCLEYHTEMPPCMAITADSSIDNDIYIYVNPPDHIHIDPANEKPTSDNYASPNFIPAPTIDEGEIYDRNIEAIQEEQEEGRIGIKLVRTEGNPGALYTGNICIRRTDSRSAFRDWVDLFIYQCNATPIEEIPIFYDYTVESGIFYQYGVQIISTGGLRSALLAKDNVRIIREFEYSYLLGKNDKQLKFKFDNDMNTFKYQIYDSKIDPIGSKYTNIARNANTYYRTFPINGLITYNMDESLSFTDRYEIFNYNNNVSSDKKKLFSDWYGEWKMGAKGYSYYKDDKHHLPNMYDFTYEKMFRDKVLEFLQDGEVKLFKSATEGNILVRLTDVTCTPVQSLNRLVYSFSATASEVNECSMENYINYGLHVVGDWAEDFGERLTRLGQIKAEIDTANADESTRNITELIRKKYDSSDKEIAGYSYSLVNYHHIKITFEDAPLRIHPNGGNSNEYVLGNKMSIKGNNINVYGYNRIYEFDGDISCTMSDPFFIYGSEEENDMNETTKVNVIVDFLYDCIRRPYANKVIKSKKTYRGVGQLFKQCTMGENLFTEISLKYYLDNNHDFSKLAGFESIDIEANPGTVFYIRDAGDGTGNIYGTHVVGITGRLSLIDIEDMTGLTYAGVQDPKTGKIVDKKQDVLINYIYLVSKGTYKEPSKTQ